MKVPSFKNFINEHEQSKAIVQTGINSKSIDNEVTKDIINSRLLMATNNPFLTPYIALGSIARVLAYINIVVPQYTFLDRDEGEVVFDATQIGKIAGVNLDGSPAKTEAEHFIYFSYSMNDDGYYDCFAALVDSDELEDIMDMGGDDDVDQFDVDQKVNEENVDESNWIKTRDDSHYNLHTGISSINKGEDTSYDDAKNAHDYYKNEVERLRANPNSYKSHIKDAEMMLRRAKKKLGIKEELKGNQHKLDVAEPKGKLTAADFKKLRGEEVDEGFDKWHNKLKKRNWLRKSGYEKSSVDHTSPGNTAAMAVRAGRDKLKKEEAQHVDEAMNWDEKNASLPAIKQPNIKAHQQAAKIHGKMLSQARKNYENDKTPENAKAVSFHDAKIKYHNNHASIMRMQGVKEEAQRVDEISDDLKRRYLAGAKKYFRQQQRMNPYGNITDKDINRTVGVRRATDTMKSPEPEPVKKNKMVKNIPTSPTKKK